MTISKFEYRGFIMGKPSTLLADLDGGVAEGSFLHEGWFRRDLYLISPGRDIVVDADERSIGAQGRIRVIDELVDEVSTERRHYPFDSSFIFDALGVAAEKPTPIYSAREIIEYVRGSDVRAFMTDGIWDIYRTANLSIDIQRIVLDDKLPIWTVGVGADAPKRINDAFEEYRSLGTLRNSGQLMKMNYVQAIRFFGFAVNYAI
jgi:hypothetical protein